MIDEVLVLSQHFFFFENTLVSDFFSVLCFTLLLQCFLFFRDNKNSTSNMKIDTLSFLGCILEHIKPETFYPHINQFFPVSMKGCYFVFVSFWWICSLVRFFYPKKTMHDRKHWVASILRQVWMELTYWQLLNDKVFARFLWKGSVHIQFNKFNFAEREFCQCMVFIRSVHFGNICVEICIQ